VRAAFATAELPLVPFLAPTSPAPRIAAVAELDPVFIYCVALVGVTGARTDLSDALGTFLGAVHAATPAPLVVGFGISQPEHVARAARYGAAGVIVASALTDLVERTPGDPIGAARAYLAEMKRAGAALAT
jgi:tryptophan synthase alpha chain